MEQLAYNDRHDDCENFAFLSHIDNPVLDDLANGLVNRAVCWLDEQILGRIGGRTRIPRTRRRIPAVASRIAMPTASSRVRSIGGRKNLQAARRLTYRTNGKRANLKPVDGVKRETERFRVAVARCAIRSPQ